MRFALKAPHALLLVPVLALAAGLLVPGSTQAQTRLALGASLATLGGNDVESADSRTGVNAGVSVILDDVPHVVEGRWLRGLGLS